MAEELRWEMLRNSLSGGSTAHENDTSFTNEAAKKLHLRSIDFAVSTGSMATNEVVVIEISKAPAQQNGVNGSNFWTKVIRLAHPSTPAGNVDGGVYTNGRCTFAKGQLTLEPGESVHVNVGKSSDPTVAYNFELGYHY